MPRLIAAVLTLLPAAALSHAGGHGHGHAGSSFLAGIGHPLGGADHLLAMVAVGLWAAINGGRALWAMPAAFVAAMALGGALGAGGVALPAVEPTILASVVLLGGAAALALRPPLAASLAAIAVFGLAHGHAHGAEGPAAGLAAYGAGFVLATAALHAAGAALGLGLARAGRAAAPRLIGAAASAAGAALALA